MKIKTIIGLVIGLAALFPIASFALNSTCPLGNGINVHTAKHQLNICKHGSVIKTFKVALGFSGVGKRKAGDNKTPVGLYRLSYPRASSQFKIFIPIQYPTSQQSAAGYTGRDVGIHGPTQKTSFLGWHSLPSSTRGCIAVGQNNYIEYVANWIKANPGTRVLII